MHFCSIMAGHKVHHLLYLIFVFVAVSHCLELVEGHALEELVVWDEDAEGAFLVREYNFVHIFGFHDCMHMHFGLELGVKKALDFLLLGVWVENAFHALKEFGSHAISSSLWV